MSIEKREEISTLSNLRIGRKLAELRLKFPVRDKDGNIVRHGLSQQEVADQVGCSRVYVSEIECGVTSPRLDILEKMVVDVMHSSLASLWGSQVPDGYTNAQHRELHNALQEILDSDGPAGDYCAAIIYSLHTKADVEPEPKYQSRASFQKQNHKRTNGNGSRSIVKAR